MLIQRAQHKDLVNFLTTQLPASGLRISGTNSGYLVTAEFNNVGDLKVGSPVSIAGVRIGSVESVSFDPKSFKAVVGLNIESNYKQIPDDSDASIQTAGLLGGKYIGLTAGGAETFLRQGSQIGFTQDAIVLENLINKLFASIAGKGAAAKGEAATAAGEKD